MINRTRSLAVDDGRGGGSRLLLKLLGLFAVSFAGFLIVFVSYDLLTSFAERRAKETEAAATVQSFTIDPKIGKDLATVLATDTSSDPADIKDPFLDRAGLSGAVAAGAAVNAATVARTDVPAAPAGPGATGQSGSAKGGPAQPAVSPSDATERRYEEWLSHAGFNNDLVLDPRIFSVEDLLPVGIVDGGNDQQEVMFYSEAVKKTFSFPLGTVFYDGWLTELRPEGVVFSSISDQRIVRMRSWARSLKEGQ